MAEPNVQPMLAMLNSLSETLQKQSLDLIKQSKPRIKTIGNDQFDLNEISRKKAVKEGSKTKTKLFFKDGTSDIYNFEPSEIDISGS